MPADIRFLNRIARKVLKGEDKEGFDISVALLSEGKIKELNRKYRKKDKATDVLSFRYDDGHGEVAICPKQVRRKKEDLAFVLIHGILHILGYSHKQMEKKQKYYFSLSI